MTDDRAGVLFALFRLGLWAVAGLTLLVQAGRSLVHYPESRYSGSALLQDGLLALVGSALIVAALTTGAESFGRRSPRAAPVRAALWLWIGALSLVGLHGPGAGDRVWPLLLFAIAVVELGLIFRWRDPPDAPAGD